MSDGKDSDRGSTEMSGSRSRSMGHSWHQARAGSHSRLNSSTESAGRRRDEDGGRVGVGHWDRIKDRGSTGVALGGSSGSMK